MHRPTPLHARQNGADRPCPVDTGPVPLTSMFTPPASCAHRFTPYSVDRPTLVQQVFDVDCTSSPPPPPPRKVKKRKEIKHIMQETQTPSKKLIADAK